MTDRRKNEQPATSEQIAKAKLNSMQFRDGDSEEAQKEILLKMADIINNKYGKTLGENVTAGTHEDKEVVEQDEKELTPEQMGRILGALQNRFNSNTNLHEGINWKDVEASLKASPEALWSLAQMETAGHAPDVYHNDESGYYFGTCSKESPESGRNCVYDKKVADWLRKNRPNEQFNGSAVEMAEAMGIKLMLPEHYKDVLQGKGEFDKETWSWLLTQSGVRSSGGALRGFRCGDVVRVDRYRARDRYADRAWRGSLRVKKVTA